MKDYLANQVRNVTVLGHSGAGKSTLIEACLYFNKQIDKFTRNSDGTSYLNFDAEEGKRGLSCYCHLAPVEWKGKKINFIDTPGYMDYEGEEVTGLTVGDNALIVVDGKEGVEGAVASNETPLGLNPVLIQDKSYSSAELKAGVTKDAVNLFNSTTTTAPVFVIPSSEPLKVTLVYDVETKDDKLSTMLSDGTTHGSTVENVITKAIQIGTSDVSLEAGKKYTIALHIGLTSVKFDASVTTWTAGSDANVDLPQNN